MAWFRAVLIGAAMLAAGAAGAWEKRDAARVFFFGNSLVNHLSDSPATTVPYWLARLAQHAGKDFASDGHWGFPRNFAAELPPRAQWHFPGVTRVWPGEGPIRADLFDSYILSVENFVQGIPPTQLYQGDNPQRQSPVDATLAVLDWIDADGADARFMIYEGWAGFSDREGFPPDAEALARHRAEARGAYHDWYLAFLDALRQARPGREVELIPVSRVMAEVLSMPELAGLPADALYADIAPHGTATTYLLAAMITYAALYGERPPAAFPGEGVAPDFARNYEAVADLIWDAMKGADRK